MGAGGTGGGSGSEGEDALLRDRVGAEVKARRRPVKRPQLEPRPQKIEDSMFLREMPLFLDNRSG